MANCPHCQKTLAALTVEEIKASLPGGVTSPALVYSCPSCLATISVQINAYGHGLETRKGPESEIHADL
jgi:hypothetical protein